MEWKSEPELAEVDEPDPGPGQVVVRVGAAGACHSDLHVMHALDGSARLGWQPPFTLGHENAGWVHSLGEGVRGLQVGEPVAVFGAWGCGRCDRCLRGLENYCEGPPPPPGGLGSDGGMAELMLVPDARHLVPLPDGLDPVAAAPLTDAGLTPYHAIRRSWPKLGPKSTAVVIGVGGLGHMAIQILKTTTAARIVAIDNRSSALELAWSLGADVCATAGASAAGRIREETRGRGADLVLDFVGSDATLRTASTATRPLGDLTVVGIGGGTFAFGFGSVPNEVSAQTTYWGSRSELAEVLDLGARGLLRATVTTFPLEEAPRAYKMLADGAIDGRAVILPGDPPGAG
jgi:propanol-preferring alcohol dehydrogenase